MQQIRLNNPFSFKSSIVHFAISKAMMFFVACFYRAKKFLLFLIKGVSVPSKFIIVHRAISKSSMFFVASFHGTNILWFFIKRISIFFESLIMQITISKPFMFSVASFYRTSISCFFVQRISIFFKSCVMRMAISTTTITICATRNRTNSIFVYFFSMIAHVFCYARTKFEIFRSVIRRVFIDMVDNFIAQKRSAKQLFHNHTMFIFPFSGLLDFNMRINVDICRTFWQMFSHNLLLYHDIKQNIKLNIKTRCVAIE